MKKTIIILFLLFPLIGESKPVQRFWKLHRPSIKPSVSVSASPSPTPSPSPSICIEPDVRYIN